MLLYIMMILEVDLIICYCIWWWYL